MPPPSSVEHDRHLFCLHRLNVQSLQFLNPHRFLKKATKAGQGGPGVANEFRRITKNVAGDQRNDRCPVRSYRTGDPFCFADLASAGQPVGLDALRTVLINALPGNVSVSVRTTPLDVIDHADTPVAVPSMG